MISAYTFPSDYAPLCPDFMFLPVSILKWQVEQTKSKLVDLLERVADEETKVAAGAPKDLDSIRNTLFILGKSHRQLRNRWIFEQELAGNITKCFDYIGRQQIKHTGSTLYSNTLRERVEDQVHLSMLLKHDFDGIPSKIKEQHKRVTT